MCRREVRPPLIRIPRLAILRQTVPIHLRVVHPLRVRIVRLVHLRRFRAARQARLVPLQPLRRLQHVGHGRGLGLCYDLLKPSRIVFE